MLDKLLPRLEVLRKRLEAQGRRPSLLSPNTNINVLEAMDVVQEYGAMCEALYLVMAADGRVLNVERQTLRGALDVLSGGRVRTAHMESMLDAAAKRVARQGRELRLQRVVEELRGDPVRAETVVLLCAAVACADKKISPAEQRVIEELSQGLDFDAGTAERLLDELTHDS